jgi:hypothetical protein
LVESLGVFEVGGDEELLWEKAFCATPAMQMPASSRSRQIVRALNMFFFQAVLFGTTLFGATLNGTMLYGTTIVSPGCSA